MLTDYELKGLITNAVSDIVHRVAHTELDFSIPTPMDSCAETFSADVHGDYELKLALCATPPILQALAQSMRRGRETDAETAAAYVSELFNILCGTIVSAINRTTHASARFGIPRIHPGLPEHCGNGCAQDFYYKHQLGPVLIRAAYREGLITKDGMKQ